MININFYEILNIPRNADKLAIKRAYFSLVKIHTPDKDPEKFRALREAYDTLLDDKKREQYDIVFQWPEYLQPNLLLARELISQSKFKQAIKLLTSMDTNIFAVGYMLASAYNRNKNNRKAQNLCLRLINKYPDEFTIRIILAQAYADMGHVIKAQDQFEFLIANHYTEPLVWISYIKYILSGDRSLIYSLDNILNQALSVSEDILKASYELYMECAIVLRQSQLAFLMFSKAEEPLANIIRCFNLFVKFFKEDKRPSLQIFDKAVKGLDMLTEYNFSLPIMKDFSLLLLTNGHCQPHHEQVLNKLLNYLQLDDLKKDRRIKSTLTNLVELTVKNCDCESCRRSRFVLEHNIVFNLPGVRRQVKELQKHYPNFFNLNERFYLNVLDIKNERLLQNKYRKKAVEYEDNDDFDDFDDSMEHMDIEDMFDILNDVFEIEHLTPFVREEAKIGRNDPCPCGSGKKYKKCCGANAG